MNKTELPRDIFDKIMGGTVIPAIPLALDEKRRFDEKRQKALVRYYIDAGAGGIAIGVHTTQFEIRRPEYGLFRPVLDLVSKTIDEHAAKRNKKIIKIGGICGRTPQALREASFLRENGFHAGLLSMADFAEDPVDVMIGHVREVAAAIPVFGFYLQPSVGGRVLSYGFWREMACVENVIGIKIAPFNRYRTIDVVRAVCDAGRENALVLYTGNDDSIVSDLLTEYRIVSDGKEKRVRIKGGLLGQWSVWTRSAAQLFERVRGIAEQNLPIPQDLPALGVQLTDANAVIFDAAHNFAGCIPGIHEVLRRQGLLAGTWCLNPSQVLSPGQSAALDRIYASYPHLSDDDFVKTHLGEWLL
ncbi:MAG: dihydrodipicolinate synthase family protein [Spirochaetales bacterium]|jgi:dihydrodipicolinate synthase/N-acetylneuraminate lyase|nr:dihydrodipicolinate synthase family protein [Spirochaetales bacterium]